MFVSPPLRSLGFLLVCLCWFAGGPATAGAVVPSGNLVQNPGAEAGGGAANASDVAPPPGWGTTSNFTAVKYGTSGFPGQAAGGGTNFFAGGPNSAGSLAEQII